MTLLGDARVPRRIWDKLEVFGENDCWMWTGNCSPAGYGRAWWNGRKEYTHRIMYQAFVAQLLPKLHTDHLCRVKSCCNPGHLEQVTAGENTKRGGWSIGVLSSRKTACPQGHDYTPENTYRSRGRRTCKACDLKRQARYRDEMRALHGRSRP